MNFYVTFFTSMAIYAPSKATNDALPKPRYLYSLSTEYLPAFSKLLYDSKTGKYDLGYTSFSSTPYEIDGALYIPDVSSKYQNKTQMKSHLITNTFIWPNSIEEVPDGTFGTSKYWSMCSGFFLPFMLGHIAVMNMTDMENPGEPVIISPTEGNKQWFYHRMMWRDMDKDGDYDAVTERVRGNGTYADESQLLWFENPGRSPPPANWKTHVIHEGFADVHFRFHKLPLPGGRETSVVVSAGFYSNALSLTWTVDNDWTNPDSIRHRIIDNAGWYFDLQIIDMNADGKDDILITTWSRPGPQNVGAVLVYEAPIRDWRIDEWTKHVLSTDFIQDISIFSGSPGSPIAYWPSTAAKEKGEKPHLLVSGDDDGNAYLMLPRSKNPSNWSYSKSTIYSIPNGICGIMAVADVDNDGYMDIFIPGYTAKEIVVMTYRP